MVQKRPFDAEEILEVSFKHPKQVGPSDQLASFSESVCPEVACPVPTSEGGCREGNRESNEKPAGDISIELPREAEDFQTSLPRGISVSSWAAGGTSLEDVRSEPLVHLPFVPEYFSPERPLRTLARHEDIYTILLEHSPRKLVSIGADHQADVLAWDWPAAARKPNASNAVSDSDFTVEDEAQKRLMGTCVIPMPQMELSTYDNEEVGKGRTDCSCEDKESARCVKQHIVEAREELVKTTGHERFTELGLFDMGEKVAEKWSAEDEQLFHEVVFNNPASLGKNFWNYLSVVFPSRTKREIVSYYFNVFMLRRRAEQNRNELLNIDSDNDEWQGTDGYEIATQEEDEDSVAESPIYRNDISLTNCHENDLQDYDECVSDETCAVNGTSDFTKRNIGDDSKYDHTEMPRSVGSPPLIQPEDKPVWQEACGEEVQGDSNTGVASHETRVKKIENGDHWCGKYNGACNGYGQGYVFEPCDAKGWDPGFVSCSKNKVDFLPTCNMIEEVFGDGRRQEIRRA